MVLLPSWTSLRLLTESWRSLTSEQYCGLLLPQPAATSAAAASAMQKVSATRRRPLIRAGDNTVSSTPRRSVWRSEWAETGRNPDPVVTLEALPDSAEAPVPDVERDPASGPD